ncbi:MAG: hypothetical protein IPH84_11035 [Bacteroidales bacterium]|nr:hypothetical protein [Bacteroidales bacterium]
MALEIQHEESILLAVPAIHYKAVFAAEVHRLCLQQVSRPDAIAVELDPESLEALILFLKALGVREGSQTQLPCMLGLISTNSVQAKGHSVLALSATDSIIEAVRLSIELGIPVHGIDTPDFPVPTMPEQLLEDSVDAWKCFSGYIERNESAAHLTRDKAIDTKREQVMVAKLKWILSKYSRVLYTGGLAHWKEIKLLLQNPLIYPDNSENSGRSVSFHRVIIHPQLALMFVDSLPVNTTIYENYRNSAAEELSFHYRKAVRIVLDSSYKHYGEKMGGLQYDTFMGTVQAFERLLFNQCLVSQRKQAGMNNVLTTAHTMMHRNYNRVLASSLMDIQRPWASQENFPGYSILYPDTSMNSEKKEVKGIYACYQPSALDHFFEILKNEYSFFLPATPELQEQMNLLQSLWLWEEGMPPKQKIATYNSWIWPPCEALLYGTAQQASRIAMEGNNDTTNTVFEGSLYDGVDIKATTRSIIQGSPRIYVKQPRLRRQTFISDDKNPEPAVFLFPSSPETNKSRWTTYIGGSSIGDHVRDRKRFEEVAREKGHVFIANVTFGVEEKIPVHLGKIVESSTLLSGITIFGNPCINSIQAADWVESNQYQCCPVVKSSSVSTLISTYRERYNLEISLDDWQSALIILAIPFVKERLLVIAPETYKPSLQIQRMLNARRVVLSIVPLGYFPGGKIEEMRHRLTVRSLDRHGCKFAPEVEFELGQAVDTYFEMLSKHMRMQLGKR